MKVMSSLYEGLSLVAGAVRLEELRDVVPAVQCALSLALTLG